MLVTVLAQLVGLIRRRVAQLIGQDQQDVRAAIHQRNVANRRADGSSDRDEDNGETAHEPSVSVAWRATSQVPLAASSLFWCALSRRLPASAAAASIFAGNSTPLPSNTAARKRPLGRRCGRAPRRYTTGTRWRRTASGRAQQGPPVGASRRSPDAGVAGRGTDRYPHEHQSDDQENREHEPGKPPARGVRSCRRAPAPPCPARRATLARHSMAPALARAAGLTDTARTRGRSRPRRGRLTQRSHNSHIRPRNVERILTRFGHDPNRSTRAALEPTGSALVRPVHPAALRPRPAPAGRRERSRRSALANDRRGAWRSS